LCKKLKCKKNLPVSRGLEEEKSALYKKLICKKACVLGCVCYRLERAGLSSVKNLHVKNPGEEKKRTRVKKLKCKKPTSK
jgi:hypothetical protein